MMMDIAETVKPDTSMPLFRLNNSQLYGRYKKMQKQLNEQKLENLNLSRNNQVMSKTISLQKRFTELVAESNIPRVGQLVKVCKSQGMGMQSIINKIHDALSDKYHCKSFTESEWDISVLALRLGGPRFMHVMHTMYGLPGISSVYKHSKDDVFAK